jgi:hypothetical protein
METSESFNFDKFMVYLESIYSKMPPFGRPRAFIDNHKPKTLLPYEINKIKQRTTLLPKIGKSKVNSGDWRANTSIIQPYDS